MRFTKDEFNTIKKDILNKYNPKKVSVDTFRSTKDYYLVDTIYGGYYFFFDSPDTIFGFISKDGIRGNFDKKKVQDLVSKNQNLLKTPNIWSGKLNFHFSELKLFSMAIDEILIKKDKKGS
jgi:hypothetical protein